MPEELNSSKFEVSRFRMSAKVSVAILFLTIGFATSIPTKKSNYIEQENSCREVCGLCDCNGFYCEDECICECSLEEDENLQCIADMQKECDANGLEYELLMQETVKERFLREVKGSSGDLSKHLVVLKQKRQSATTEPTLGVTPSTEPVVAAAQNSSSVDEENKVGIPLPALASSIGGKSAIAGKTAISTLTVPKLLVLMRERLANVVKPATTLGPFVLPKLAKFSIPALPTLAPVVQPAWLQH